jgi:hypothetical protein
MQGSQVSNLYQPWGNEFSLRTEWRIAFAVSADFMFDLYAIRCSDVSCANAFVIGSQAVALAVDDDDDDDVEDMVTVVLDLDGVDGVPVVVPAGEIEFDREWVAEDGTI